MKRYTILLTIIAATIAGCSTLPQGWDTAQSAIVEQAGARAAALYNDKQTVRTPVQACALVAGQVGADWAVAARAKGVNSELRKQQAVKRALEACKKMYPELLKDRTLGSICAEALGYEKQISDAEALLAMMYGFQTRAP